jgi:hypothetical protein
MLPRITSTFRTLSIKQILVAHLLGIPVAYLLTSYFATLYTGLFSFIFVTLIFQILCGTAIFLFFNGPHNITKTKLDNYWVSILVLTVAAVLVVSVVAISWHFRGLFNQRLVSMDMTLIPWFIGLVFVSVLGTATLITIIQRKDIVSTLRSSSLFQFFQINRAGIFLSLLYFLTYFILTQSLNFPGYNTVDQYFDADISSWISRLTFSPGNEMPDIRAVHPAIMIILRPVVGLVSILMNGNKLQAVFFLSALTGALCVFLVWLIAKNATGDTTYSLIVASLLGASASHLLFSSMLETYIFSALALIVFCYLVISDRASLETMIPMGIIIFGITVTNLAQACILYFFKKPRIKIMLTFILTVVIVTILLNVLQVNLYKNAYQILKPANLTFEQRYMHRQIDSPWRLRGRVNLVGRAILLYGIVAPDPYILMEELGTNVPNFRTFKITIGEFHVAGYKGLADIVAYSWMAVLGLAFSLFIVDLFKTPRQMAFPISLLLCMGFNFALHFFYGDDVMLYSPDWVYALVLFVSLSLGKWAQNRWLQIGLIVFLGMMIYKNLSLIYQIMEVSLPYYGK